MEYRLLEGVEKSRLKGNITMAKIADEGFPGNSYKSKAPRQEESRKVERVVKGVVRKRKKTPGRILQETFLGDDASSVMSYILWEVLIPAAKTTLSEMVSGGIEMLLFGGSPHTRSSGRTRSPSRSIVSYGEYYGGGRGRSISPAKPGRETGMVYGRPRQTFDDVILESRGDAEEVLTNLVELISQYGVASIADFYDLVGGEPAFTDYKYGWDNLSQSNIQRTRDGYVVNLPRPIQLT